MWPKVMKSHWHCVIFRSMFQSKIATTSPEENPPHPLQTVLSRWLVIDCNDMVSYTV